MLLIRRQAIFRNGDANDLFFAAAKDFERDNIIRTNVKHHIDDVILTGDLGGVTVYGRATRA